MRKGLKVWLSAMVATSTIVSGCKEKAPAPAPPDAVATAAPTAPGGPTKQTGDFKNGWKLFLEHCSECHGERRRGAGQGRTHLLVAPADLRDPVLLASRTDDDLTKTILQGGSFSGKSKWMPGFAAQLGEQDVMDILALLRGDSIDLADCFPDAGFYMQVPTTRAGPPVLSAYSNGPRGASRPVLLETRSALPANAKKVGYLMFAELDLPKAGPTPVAFIADVGGKVSAMRVALPPPYNTRAQHDLETMVLKRIDRIPGLGPTLDEGLDRILYVTQEFGEE